jgi:putative transposase
MTKKQNKNNFKKHLPDAEAIAKEMARVEDIDDFFGKGGVFSNLFSKSLEAMVQGELTDHLGYDKYEATGKNSGNSRNGAYKRKIRTSNGDSEINVARDRNGDFKPEILRKYQTSSNEIEDKVVAMYSHGMTARDITKMLEDSFGLTLSAAAISQITDKIWPLVEEWQNKPLKEIYTLTYLDCIHIKLRKEGKIVNTAVYIALAINLEGKKECLGHWVGDKGEGSSFWLSVLEDIQARGVKDILIASVDGLTGFSEAIQAVFPETIVQKCVIHQIRNSVRYVSWKDRKEFTSDLKKIYKANTLEQAEAALQALSKKWKSKYAVAVKSWETNWDELSSFFDFSKQIRRMMYTTNAIEAYNRQIRKVTKNRSVFSTEKSIRKLFYLAHRNIAKSWTMPIHNWPLILNQLVIKFEGRVAI